MSERKICSRREADDYIQKGWVKVNGEVVDTLGTKVDESVKVTLDKKALEKQSQKITILLHKPLGYVSCQPEKGYKSALSLIRPKNRDPKDKKRQKLPQDLTKLAVVGRLDINSKGLLLITQDGRLAKELLSQDNEVEKEYLVRVEGEVTKEKLKLLSFGLKLDQKPLKRAKVEEIEPNLLKVILIEGKKRQIRRMCEQVDLEVKSLKRVRIGLYKLGSLPLGKWKLLS